MVMMQQVVVQQVVVMVQQVVVQQVVLMVAAGCDHGGNRLWSWWQ